jgi:hypothetical protein
MSSTSSLSNTAFVAAIDQGTSSTRVILYNSSGENLVSHQVPLKLITPTPGWVEQDPEEIIETVRSCLREVARKAKEEGHSVSAQSIKAVGLTNQRETTVVWDKHTGKALYNTVGTDRIQKRRLLGSPVPSKSVEAVTPHANHKRDSIALIRHLSSFIVDSNTLLNCSY